MHQIYGQVLWNICKEVLASWEEWTKPLTFCHLACHTKEVLSEEVRQVTQSQLPPPFYSSSDDDDKKTTESRFHIFGTPSTPLPFHHFIFPTWDLFFAIFWHVFWPFFWCRNPKVVRTASFSSTTLTPPPQSYALCETSAFFNCSMCLSTIIFSWIMTQC